MTGVYDICSRYLPNMDIIPQLSHMTKLIPTDPAPSNTPLGETNIPEPIIT